MELRLHRSFELIQFWRLQLLMLLLWWLLLEVVMVAELFLLCSSPLQSRPGHVVTEPDIVALGMRRSCLAAEDLGPVAAALPWPDWAFPAKQ